MTNIRSRVARIAGLLIVLYAAGAASLAFAEVEKRVALVIGNASYKDSPLKNPVNDVRGMAEALRGMGFKVIARENATKQQMERAVAEFGEALPRGAVALFYYAGHALQVGGHNYLVPVDAQITAERTVRLETLDLDLVLDQVMGTGSDVNIVILDACRNNPFERRFRGQEGGLAQINAPKGTMIAYATAPGRVASDGGGDNGLYTSKLVDAIKTPGLPIEEVFKKVRIEVARETNDEQTPWEASSLIGTFYFTAPAKVVINAQGDRDAAPHEGVWEGEQGIWRMRARVTGDRIEGYIRCLFKGTWGGSSPFVGVVHPDGTVKAESSETIRGWAPRFFGGTLPTITIAGQGKLDCPNGEVALKKVK